MRVADVVPCIAPVPNFYEYAPEENMRPYWECWAYWVNDARGQQKIARKEAQGILDAAYRDQHEQLDLSYKGLTSLPQLLPPSLVSLDASHNKLKRLSNVFFDKIQKIDLSYNAITEMQHGFPLRFDAFDIRHNPLTKEEIEHLRMLKDESARYGLSFFFTDPPDSDHSNRVKQVISPLFSHCWPPIFGKK